jgi:hypothetical protein
MLDRVNGRIGSQKMWCTGPNMSLASRKCADFSAAPFYSLSYKRVHVSTSAVFYRCKIQKTSNGCAEAMLVLK